MDRDAVVMVVLTAGAWATSIREPVLEGDLSRIYDRSMAERITSTNLTKLHKLCNIITSKTSRLNKNKNLIPIEH